ncbi:MAG: MogA/MoaB family molybdenum cofactor biosynthesis protein [Gemmatimonadota bacterium]
MTPRIAVLIISDSVTSGERTDKSGAAIVAWAGVHDFRVTAQAVVPDEVGAIISQLCAWADGNIADVILTTGGTGFGPRDVTPEATRAVITRDAPGIPEAIRAAAFPTTPKAALSRAIAGTRAASLIVNLPGSLGGVRDGLAVMTSLVPHIAQLLQGDTEH